MRRAAATSRTRGDNSSALGLSSPNSRRTRENGASRIRSRVTASRTAHSAKRACRRGPSRTNPRKARDRRLAADTHSNAYPNTDADADLDARLENLKGLEDRRGIFLALRAFLHVALPQYAAYLEVNEISAAKLASSSE